jgi:sigma-B regulation protein RsbU (phosphoserine phosphatase)
MMTRLSFRRKIILLVLALNVALTAILSAMMYRNERAAVLRGIDQKLLSGATGIGELFPESYHSKISGPGSVSDSEYHSYSKRLTDLANRNDFQWLYTYMQVDGQIVTTATSADRKNPSKVVPFLTVYQQPSSKIRQAFAERKPFFDDYTDEFGHVRSAFVPFVTSSGQVFVAGSDVSIDFIDEMLSSDLRQVALISTLVSIGFVLVSVFVASRMSRPIGELASLTTSLGERSFSLSEEQGAWLHRVSAGKRDEVGDLASAFIQMDGMLKQYIANLRETTAAKERIESELNIARSIQDSFLHKLFPPFPDRPEFDLFATLEPAKEVGGDLYDFVLIGDELYFCVGDVSDKGVPAALLMVVTQTLMRAAAQQPAVDPATMLTRVNADILEKNEMLMFVTMFCGVLKLSTGELRYSNAGHNPPLILRSTGEAEWLTLPDGMVLGVMPDLKYETFTTTFKPGDTLLAYTDGVTEAKSPQSTLYSDEKLLHLLAAQAGNTPAQLVTNVMHSVKEHASTAPQSDDITVLALRFGGARHEHAAQHPALDAQVVS